MFRAMKSNIRRAAGTHADLRYVGSPTVDSDLVDVSDPLSRR